MHTQPPEPDYVPCETEGCKNLVFYPDGVPNCLECWQKEHEEEMEEELRERDPHCTCQGEKVGLDCLPTCARMAEPEEVEYEPDPTGEYHYRIKRDPVLQPVKTKQQVLRVRVEPEVGPHDTLEQMLKGRTRMSSVWMRRGGPQTTGTHLIFRDKYK